MPGHSLPDGPEKDRLKDAGGIGTPATRDSIIAGLVRQGQVKLDGKGRSARYMPTARGWTLWQILDRHLCELVDPGMTAIWEAEFDALAQSDGADWWGRRGKDRRPGRDADHGHPDTGDGMHWTRRHKSG